MESAFLVCCMKELGFGALRGHMRKVEVLPPAPGLQKRCPLRVVLTLLERVELLLVACQHLGPV